MKVLFLGGNLVMTGYQVESPQSAISEGCRSPSTSESLSERRLTSGSAEVCSPRTLANWLEQQGEHVVYTENKIAVGDLRAIRPSLIVSYDHKHILSKEMIDDVHGNAINLHISFLPYNRGYHPYVWSFLENTPKGVTIHYIDEGIDSGDILVQKEIYIDEKQETIRSAFEILHRQIQALFKENWNKIKNNELTPQPQMAGSIHFRTELAKFEPFLREKGWDTPIRELKAKYKKHEVQP